MPDTPQPPPSLADDIKFTVLVDRLSELITAYAEANECPTAMMVQALEYLAAQFRAARDQS